MTGPAVNVAIVGCGAIGARWEARDERSAVSLSHAAAFSRHPHARLVAVCDRDGDKARDAARRWHVAHAFTDAAALFTAQRIDVAVIATASGERSAVIAPALATGVKVLVIEKPLAATLEESRALIAAIEAAGATALVNFTRRWDFGMRALREDIAQGRLGAIQRSIAVYGKGLRNNGSHMIDLVGFLCSAAPVRARALGSPLDGAEAAWSAGDDRAFDAQVVFAVGGGQIQLTLLGSDQRAFTCFELRLYGSRGIVELALGGRRHTRTFLDADPDFAGYRVPLHPQPQPSGTLHALDAMAAEAVGIALGTAASSCSAGAALPTAMAVDAIERSARAQQSWIELAA